MSISSPAIIISAMWKEGGGTVNGLIDIIITDEPKKLATWSNNATSCAGYSGYNNDNNVIMYVLTHITVMI